MFSPQRLAGSDLPRVSAVFFAAWLFLVCVGSTAQVAAQTTTTTLTERTDRSRPQLSDLRQRRDRLHRALLEQQTRIRQLVEQEKNLLSLQAQLQQKIGHVERELKLPQLPAEYQTKKCKLLDLQTKQQDSRTRISENQRIQTLIQQQINQIQQGISQTQQQITQVQQQDNEQALQQQQQEQQRQQAEQQQQGTVDPMAARMTAPANPLSGLPVNTAQATVANGHSGSGVLVFTGTTPIGSTGFTPDYAAQSFMGGPYCSLGGTTRVTVTVTINSNNCSLPLTFGVYTLVSGSFSGGSPTVNVGQTGTFIYDLTNVAALVGTGDCLQGVVLLAPAIPLPADSVTWFGVAHVYK
jgi:hypothetical protein